MKRCQFVSGVVMGSGWELKHHLDLLQFNQTFWPDRQALYAVVQRNGSLKDPEWPIYDSTDGTLSFMRFKRDGGQVKRMEISKAFYKPGRPQVLREDARGRPRRRQCDKK